MRAVYVAHDGATVRREGGILQVYAQRRKVADIPVRELEQLVLMGNVILTPGALDLLIESKVDIVFLTHHGRYRGRLIYGLSSNLKLRMAQYKRLSDEATTLILARDIVKAKILNSRTLLLRHARRHGDEDGRLMRGIRALSAALAGLEIIKTLDDVRGFEGAAAAAYFRAFGGLIRAPGFFFDGRNRRPPLDPVNALLSLGYTLLANAIEAAVQIVGLDPYLGSLHAVQTGRPSLVCDLQEEMRAPLVDALVVAAINRKHLTPEDFEDQGPGEPVLVKRESVRAFIRMFEERLGQSVFYPQYKRSIPWRQVLVEQARGMARFLLEESGKYEPFIVR